MSSMLDQLYQFYIVNGWWIVIAGLCALILGIVVIWHMVGTLGYESFVRRRGAHFLVLVLMVTTAFVVLVPILHSMDSGNTRQFLSAQATVVFGMGFGLLGTIAVTVLYAIDASSNLVLDSNHQGDTASFDPDQIPVNRITPMPENNDSDYPRIYKDDDENQDSLQGRYRSLKERRRYSQMGSGRRSRRSVKKRYGTKDPYDKPDDLTTIDESANPDDKRSTGKAFLIDTDIKVQYAITQRDSHIGRGNDQDIQISNQTVSRKHAILKKRDHVYILRHISERSHTYVNKYRLKRDEDYQIYKGDIIQFGEIEFSFVTDN